MRGFQCKCVSQNMIFIHMGEILKKTLCVFQIDRQIKNTECFLTSSGFNPELTSWNTPGGSYLFMLLNSLKHRETGLHNSIGLTKQYNGSNSYFGKMAMQHKTHDSSIITFIHKHLDINLLHMCTCHVAHFSGPHAFFILYTFLLLIQFNLMSTP